MQSVTAQLLLQTARAFEVRQNKSFAWEIDFPTLLGHKYQIGKKYNLRLLAYLAKGQAEPYDSEYNVLPIVFSCLAMRFQHSRITNGKLMQQPFYCEIPFFIVSTDPQDHDLPSVEYFNTTCINTFTLVKDRALVRIEFEDGGNPFYQIAPGDGRQFPGKGIDFTFAIHEVIDLPYIQRPLLKTNKLTLNSYEASQNNGSNSFLVFDDIDFTQIIDPKDCQNQVCKCQFYKKYNLVLKNVTRTSNTPYGKNYEIRLFSPAMIFSSFRGKQQVQYQLTGFLLSEEIEIGYPNSYNSTIAWISTFSLTSPKAPITIQIVRTDENYLNEPTTDDVQPFILEFEINSL